MNKELFIIDDETGYVDINKAWLQTIKEFKPLFLLKRNQQPGDNEGRRRERCVKEFTFIYHYVDHRSIFRDYPDSERKEKALENAGLPKNYIIDRDLEDAMRAYKQHKETQKIKLLNSVKTSIDKLQDYFLMINFTDLDEYGKPIHSVKDYSQVVKGLEGVLSTLDALEDSVRKEQSLTQRIQGDANKGLFEDPSSMLRL